MTGARWPINLRQFLLPGARYDLVLKVFNLSLFGVENARRLGLYWRHWSIAVQIYL